MPKLPTNWFRKVLLLTGIGLGVVLLAVLYCNWRVQHDTATYTFTRVAGVPHNRVGLLLGTSNRLRNGSPNPFFNYRIAAAVSLYRQKKVDYLVVSGDNSQKHYNEPEMMKTALVKRGVPANRIYMDYAGLRTLDSVVRCRKIFGQSRFTIISQAFHNQRALFIAQHYGLDAVGFNARDVTGRNGLKVQFREMLARVKVFLDLYLLNKQPKYLGEEVKIG
ncbi:MAG: YdcF family protein [Cytophagales bacterium]|nr:YdcF family protein [Cytophagales bacterium]